MIKTVIIKRGDFMMGSPINEPHRHSDEGQRIVTLTYDFEMSVTPITIEEYCTLLKTDHLVNKNKDYPVTVDWDKAAKWCNKLSLQKGLPEYYYYDSNKGSYFPNDRPISEEGYRLPTEAEWEYACRAGTSGPCYGDIHDIANHSEYTVRGTNGAPVAQRIPNSWGLYDMLGCIEEWTNDMYLPTVDECVNPCNGRHPNKKPDIIVTRGGSYHILPEHLRAADRDYHSTLATNVGFRIVRTMIAKDNVKDGMFCHCPNPILKMDSVVPGEFYEVCTCCKKERK
jgi:formylglycine-generating enzyme required for sulfatase activity